MRIFLRLSLLAASLTLLCAAPVLRVGDPVPAFKAQDQHGQAFEFKPGVRYLLVSFDMSSGKAANRVLAEKGAGYLEKAKAVYMANIHGMPAIGRMFALPKMRKYPHRIILADDEKLLEPFPVEKGRITVLALDEAGKIKSITFWNPETEKIDRVLGGPES